MKKIAQYYKPYTWLILITIVLLIGQVLMELQLPTYMSDIINNGVIAGDTPYIYNMGIKMLFVALVLCCCAIGVSFFASRVSAKVSMNLRSGIFRKVTSFSPAEMEKFSTASLITRSTNDIQQIQTATVMVMRMGLYAPVMGAGALIKALDTNVKLSWTIGLALICVIALLMTMYFTTMPKFKLIQKMVDGVNLVVNERLSGILVIRAFNTEKYEQARFEKVNANYTGLNLFVNRAMSFMMPGMMLIMNLTSVLVVWAGAKYIDTGSLMIGDVLAFTQYAMLLIMSFLFIAMMFIIIPRATVSMNRVGKVLSTEVSISDTKNPQTFPETSKGNLAFENVSFKYPDAEDYVLNDISFTAKPGQTTAFIGSTGSGKSSLVNLIPRFFDITAGKILIDGVNIKDVTLHDLRGRIGYVPQKALLFSGTINTNIAFSDENMSEESIKRAVRIAQSSEFVTEKEDGYDSLISQGGTNISGGQKQRLSIARALAKDSNILIFDDSFSALDFTTDANLRKALKKDCTDKTILIVAQRINTIIDADQIIVLDEGRIVGSGTHKELLVSCPVYKEIALSQLDEDKLAGGVING